MCLVYHKLDVTNQVGVDINLAASHNWLFAPLQFVSGLGPRKAGSLQRALVRAGVVTSRMYLIAHGLESYPLAEALAGEVHTKYAETADYDETPIEYVKNNPQLLQNFIVHNYAEDNNKDKRETLYDIKMELLHGFYQLDDVDLTDKLQAGHVLACKIKQIQKNRYQLIITCKESELNNSQCQNPCDVDPYYREHQMHALSQVEKSCRAVVAKKNFIPRMIVHPHFRNMTADEAKEKEIVEDRKDQKASLLTLGTH
ncbi:transcription elongation factor spt6 like protein [Quercus suber]|uniref:Transcription elongation factor spt6 like protein n=1 Tax=Quercus suber TaxID=58331 RepID=A0AAW0KEH0_QUESU